MSTIFTKIIKGEIPCQRLAENDRFLAFLDVRPIAHGHALVIPKVEVDDLFDLDDAMLGEVMVFARPVARALEKVVSCERVGIMVAGLEIPHAHVHLVPIKAISDLNFANSKAAEPGELKDLADKVRAVLGTES